MELQFVNDPVYGRMLSLRRAVENEDDSDNEESVKMVAEATAAGK